MAEEQNKIDKKAEKARRREAKKKKKQGRQNGEMSQDAEEEGGGFAVVFVTIVIVVVWLAILVLLIKWDVGGFGSTVMTPILKNVPYVNKILPETDTGLSDTETEYPYQTLDEAISYIKTLELELQEAQKGNQDNSAYVTQLEDEIAKLREYEANEAAFEAEKEKFYNEVVFSDEAPDINEYRQYYESIDPAYAETLYKQVVEQQEADKEIQDYVEGYSKMKPKEAAAIFDTMTNNFKLVAKILENMSAQTRADILGKMNEENAAKITEIMNPLE
jgi:flagellar motility protein MotE (MotC chaperone)